MRKKRNGKLIVKFTTLVPARTPKLSHDEQAQLLDLEPLRKSRYSKQSEVCMPD